MCVDPVSLSRLFHFHFQGCDRQDARRRRVVCCRGRLEVCCNGSDDVGDGDGDDDGGDIDGGDDGGGDDDGVDDDDGDNNGDDGGHEIFQVLDRLCLVLFTIFTALATIIVLMAAPHVIVK